RGAGLGEGQRPERSEPDDCAAVAADPVLIPSQTLECGIDLRGLAALAVEHGHLEFFTKRLDRVGRVLRAPPRLAPPAPCHPRAGGLPEPHTLLQEGGFALLHDPMIQRACTLDRVLASSRRI